MNNNTNNINNRLYVATLSSNSSEEKEQEEKMNNNNTIVTGIPESLIESRNVPHPADHIDLFRQTGENEYEYIGPDDFVETAVALTSEEIASWKEREGHELIDADEPDEVETDLYCEGRAKGFEMIRDNLLGDDVPEPVFAGILDEWAQFLVEIGLADEFRETLEHTEELNEEMEEEA